VALLPEIGDDPALDGREKKRDEQERMRGIFAEQD
jgi:hypothetical protein